ncbi:hypothetical protein Nepgr_027599 [Nepenthes gracilis]|uniref:BRCT domain-containing protein n=1 Tax=Nepenthes gracilis TaxID=150966 RepID=A0AAD3Y3Q0_NEPGR|nr:hypothetical protein Nepgr_027599 [Nepenthes gracilis]
MLEPKQEFHFNPFVGVRFVLFGFDCLKHDEVRSKLVREGGVDVGQYGLDCTHVIVDKLVYDDPICVAARSDGKILVTSLWVDHSLDVGIPVDTSPIMYKPVKDLNGIPGAKHLIICLTGYQRQDRDDIMTMVSLMRAQFSKPLVANKVTHLICYKFEGEKYELAKRLKKIKLVNHRWLQDCLKAWKILPEENYSKSGYELEVEAEAKDSEEETEAFDAKLTHRRKTSTSPHSFQNKSPHSVQNKSPHSVQNNMPGNHDPLIIGGTVANNGPGLQNLSAHSLQNKILENQDAPIIGVRASNAGPSGLPNIGNTKDLTSIVQEEIKSFQAFESNHFKQVDHPERNYGDSSGVSDHLLNTSATDLPSASGSAKMLAVNADACKFDALTYSRKIPSKSNFTLHSREDSGNTCTPSKGRLGVDEGRCGFLISSPKVDQVKEKTDSICVEAPLMGTDVDEVGLNSLVPQKRKMDGQVDVSHTRSKPQKVYTLANKKINATDATMSISGSLGMSKPDSLSHLGGLIIDGSVTTFSAQKTSDNVSTNSYFDKRLLETNQPISRNLASGTVESRNSNVSIIAITGIDSQNGDQQNQLQNRPTSSPVKDPEVEKPGIPKLKSAGGIDTSLSKPVRRKTVAKKTLGSRPKLNTGNAAYRKGSIYLSRTSAQDNVAMHSLTELGAAEHAKEAVNLEGKDERSGNNVDDHAGPMDDETEAPPESEKAEREKKSKSDQLSSMGGTETGEILGAVELTTVEADTNAAVTTNQNEHEKVVYAEKPGTTDSSKDKLAKGKKTNAAKIKIVSDLKEPKMPADLQHDKVAKNGKKKGKEKNKKRVLQLALPSDSSVEVEKENEPAVDNYQKTPKGGDKCVGKLTSKKNSDQKAVNKKGDVSNLIRKEPAWFILSGHRLQRKEFQQVIRRLKGRLCRDSHQWSYQATHFIIPDPIRRTEKFFAAAASGRWILKTDYLTASSQAGRFLPEEPYEWHKNGLTEDGAINLEAPRKWRLLRERTSHGAFYGMRIVIYGECIAPPLDTLKRVVKAGDGTILATSPPYTRFLKSGVDFAIVSPGMPCVDMWVQEFLQHEIPCVVADYLVDYVCKPGYSLERHVQYNTQNWAAKSFANLLSRSKEIVNSPGLGPSPDKEFNDDELACEVCGCSDRGEVMLICGDESGCHGCGIGTHIDCCDPPLKQVPEEDWFCPKCTTITNPKSKK